MIRPVPAACRSGIGRADGVIRLGASRGLERRGGAMSSGQGPAKGESLADRFASLWEGGGPPPDVFAFLGAHPEATTDERVDVVRVDQRHRWHTGQGRPVEHYLIGVP